ncbi:MAG: type II toxin-antitoxin system YoeB family toxin [Saprospiraceae bacterium]|nr:type II toxin-antitoxin system YoeB family toxin [Candidatus Defluviibacterium haderslevense]MBK7243198.1 type II toxin-antitoxin system YoeB family toxin [Candidatus Defluviibacterium haderslevense]
MRYIFVDESWEDYLYWQKTDKNMLLKINNLLKDISRPPFSDRNCRTFPTKK